MGQTTDQLTARVRITVVRFVKFSIVGALSVLFFIVVYVAVRTVWPVAAANLVALLAGGVVNTEANRRWTFERAPVARFRMHVKGIVLLLVAYVCTTGAVLILQAVHPQANRLTEVVVLVVVDGAMVVFRFVGLDRWAIRAGHTRPGASGVTACGPEPRRWPPAP